MAVILAADWPGGAVARGGQRLRRTGSRKFRAGFIRSGSASGAGRQVPRGRSARRCMRCDAASDRGHLCHQAGRGDRRNCQQAPRGRPDSLGQHDYRRQGEDDDSGGAGNNQSGEAIKPSSVRSSPAMATVGATARNTSTSAVRTAESTPASSSPTPAAPAATATPRTRLVSLVNVGITWLPRSPHIPGT
jgi:hypothetical protein